MAAPDAPGPGDPARDELTARRLLVARFLGRCRAWGTEREIPATMARLSASPNPADAARLHQWTTWVAFLDHALVEIDQGQLDGWLGDDVEGLSPAHSSVAGPTTAG